MRLAAIIRLSGSWWVLAALLIAHAGLYAAIGLHEEAPFERFLQILWHTPAGMALYAALASSLAAASAFAIIRRQSPKSITPDDIRAMDSYVELAPGAIEPELWIKERGFSAKKIDGGCIARKGVFAIVPGSVARIGLLILLVSLPASEILRESGEALMVQGQSARLLGENITLESLSPGLPAEFFHIGDSATFEISSASARLVKGQDRIGISGSGPVSSSGIYYKIAHIGYRMELGKGEDRRIVHLDILPPGKTQRLGHEAGQKNISIRMEPEELVRKGLLTGKRYSMREPLFAIKLEGEDKAAIMLRPGQRDESAGLRLGPLGHYAKVLAVRDPALLWVRAGLYIALAGVLMMLGRFFWYERRFAFAAGKDRIVLGYSEEFLKKWGVYKFRKWTEGLSGD